MNVDFWGAFAIGVITGLAVCLAGVGVWAAMRGGQQRSELEEYKDAIATRLHERGLDKLRIQTAGQLVDCLADAVKTVERTERCVGVNLVHLRRTLEPFLLTSDQVEAARQMVYPLIGELAIYRETLAKTGFELVHEYGKVVGLRGHGMVYRVAPEWEDGL